MIINVDRTASMTLPTTGGTRCFVSQNALIAILNAYLRGRDYDVTKASPSEADSTTLNGNCPCHDDTDTPCPDTVGQDPYPTAGTRKVQVREFQGDVMSPLWTDGDNGFIAVDDAINRLQNLAGWYSNGVSLGNCPGPSTPMAQAMCRAARTFPTTGAPLGTVWIIKTLTDGEENSSQVVPLEPGEARCREPTDDDAAWRTKVAAEYMNRGIITDTVLWGGVGALSATSLVLEPNGETRGRAFAASGPSLAATPDEEFFAALAEATGGSFRFIDPSTPVSSEITLIDSDGDTIPDFRDQCVGDCAADRDRDGTPDASDACPLLAEDGRSPSRSDGCPDTDFDGIHDGVDRCPTEADDHVAPFPRDGCRSAHWSASATPNLPFRGLVCTSRFVVSPTGAASLAKLSIAGSHSSRAGLRGALFRNLDVSEAFPVGTFPAGAGTFGFTDRPVDMAPSSATGLWTLCIADTNGFGASGVLNSWSIHD